MHTLKHTLLIHRLMSPSREMTVEKRCIFTCFPTFPQTVYFVFSVISYISQNDLTHLENLLGLVFHFSNMWTDVRNESFKLRKKNKCTHYSTHRMTSYGLLSAFCGSLFSLYDCYTLV